MDAMMNRRSVRKYLDKPISDEMITTLLRAAMRAPSAGNEQPWEFVVMQARDMLTAAAGVSPYAKPLLQAPCAIVVCGNLQRCKFLGKEMDYWIQDCSAAIENILLQAYDLGLGGVWLGIHPVAERVDGLRALLGLPEHVIPLGIVSLGHPAETPTPVDTFQADRVHMEKWGQKA